MAREGDAVRHARTRWDTREVNVLLVVVLTALTAILALVGWWYRPGGSAYPTVPRRLAFTVAGNARSLVMTVTRVGTDGAVLTLYDDDRFQLGPEGHGVTPRGWSVGIDGLGRGEVVRRPGGDRVPVPPGDSLIDHTRKAVPTVHRSHQKPLTDLGRQPAVRVEPDDTNAPLYLRIRWQHHAPVRVDGAYVSAHLPGVTVYWPGPAPASLPMMTALEPMVGDVGRFAFQATASPATRLRSWTWSSERVPDATAPGEQPRASVDPIALSAVNVAQTQQENVRTFFIGVLLGVAGGAVLGVILELVKVRRIRPGA